MRPMAIIRQTFQLPPPAVDNLRQLGSRVSLTRKIQRLKQEDLATIAGISRSTLVEIEKGSPYVSVGAYVAALWALGIMSDILATEMTDEERRLVASDLPKRVRHG